MYAISSLLLVVAVSLVITRIGTVILVASGLSREAARFEARSAFTGTGFTTNQSASVVNHPLRRKVVMTLMLLGNAGIVAAASTLILGFRSGGAADAGFRVLELVSGLLALVLVSRSKWVDGHLTSLISHVLKSYTDLATRDLEGLLNLSGTYAVSELGVVEGDWVAGRTLSEVALRDEGVAVLGIVRPGGHYQGSPIGSTKIVPGDTLVLYGQSRSLEEIDHRPAGAIGDLEHEAAVSRQSRIIRTEHSRDPVTSGHSRPQQKPADDETDEHPGAQADELAGRDSHGYR